MADLLSPLLLIFREPQAPLGSVFQAVSASPPAAAHESRGRSRCPAGVPPAPSARLERGTEVQLAACPALSSVRAGGPTAPDRAAESGGGF